MINHRMKICSRCGIEKPDDEFYPYKKRCTFYKHCKACHGKMTSKNHQDNLDVRKARLRENYLNRQYSITMADYEAMLASQDHRCAACGSVLRSGRETHIDHDHSCCPTERSCGRCIRGLLCHPCNLALGCVKDNPDILRSLIDYLHAGVETCT